MAPRRHFRSSPKSGSQRHPQQPRIHAFRRRAHVGIGLPEPHGASRKCNYLLMLARTRAYCGMSAFTRSAISVPRSSGGSSDQALSGSRTERRRACRSPRPVNWFVGLLLSTLNGYLQFGGDLIAQSAAMLIETYFSRLMLFSSLSCSSHWDGCVPCSVPVPFGILDTGPKRIHTVPHSFRMGTWGQGTHTAEIRLCFQVLEFRF